MGLRAKVVAITAAFALTLLAAYSIITVHNASLLVGEANSREVAAVSARLALAVERAWQPEDPLGGSAFAELIRAEVKARRMGDAVLAVRLVDSGTDGPPLEAFGRWPESGAVIVVETLRFTGEGPLRLEVAAPTRGFQDILGAAYVPLAAGLAVTLVLGSVLLALMNRAYLRPVMELRRATQEVSQGELEVDINVRTGDELEELADSFSGMLDRLAEMQELALDANPLTGLPGNATIQRFVESAMESGRPCAVVYADLDSFKAYNDVYGFEAGDRIIALTAELLVGACAEHDPDAFVGHVGGDDFIFATDPGLAGRIGGEIIARFDARVREFYSETDRERGCVVAKDRQHNEQRFPLMGLSMACVDLGRRKFTHFSELAVAAAELKGEAKKQAGSVFLEDRRGR